MKKQILVIMLLFLGLFTFIGCKEKIDDTGDSTTVQTIKIKGKSQVQINGELQLTYSLTPATATTTVTWTSSNTSVAVVNNEGLVKGLEIGVSKITVTTANGKSATKIIQVKEYVDAEYPDLGGYTIKIAHSDNRLYEYDPFYEDEDGVTYGGADIAESKEAWNWVEDTFNCHMEVVPYPSDAAWGDSRWNYIIDQARNNQTNYDFYVITDTYISGMIQGGAIYDVTDWYDKYGNGIMSYDYRASGTYKGKLYTIQAGENAVYNMCGVNLNLLEHVQEAFPEKNILEPAKIFNDGNWNFDTFYDYCKVFQECLDSLYNNQVADSASRYYVLSGVPSYFLIGMMNASGICVSDTTSMKINLNCDIATQAANMLYKMFAEGMIDPSINRNQYVSSWNLGHSLFNNGELWFYNDSTRWPSDLWGEGEQTRYGYVPYPIAPGMTKEQNRFPVFGGQVLVMGTGRDYSGYGEDCTAENIYYAWMAYENKRKELYEASEGYDKEGSMIASFNKLLASEESVKALLYLDMNGKEFALYDPMCYENNPVADLYDSDLGRAMKSYITHTGTATWAETVEPYIDSLQKQLVQIYG